MTVPSSTIASSFGFGRVAPLLTGGTGVGHRRAENRVAGTADRQCYRPAAETEELLPVEGLLRQRERKIEPDRAERRRPEYTGTNRAVHEHPIV